MKTVSPQQMMGGLKIRHFPQRAFAETGLDFAGPFETTQGRGKTRRTRFVLVLTCLQTRAVHFEPTFNQTTESVINALNRFCSIRGRPTVLVSDNQTSFKKADKVLQDYARLFFENLEIIQEKIDHNQPPVEWEFIPPRAPHVGGSWEIMVKAMKRAISAIGQNQTMDDDTFVTFLCRAMDLINQRPLLKHYSSDTAHILTPNDFIIGRVDTSIFPFLVEPPTSRLNARSAQLEVMTDQLWHRFIHEILPELSPRQKWKKEFNDLDIGSIVLIIEPGTPRAVWKVGKVIEVMKGRDGLTRTAKMRVGKSEVTRPITKLIPLID